MKTYLHTLAAALLAPCALFAGTVELTVDADTTLSAALAAEGKTLSSGDTLVKKGLGKLTSDQVFGRVTPRWPWYFEPMPSAPYGRSAGSLSWTNEI